MKKGSIIKEIEVLALALIVLGIFVFSLPTAYEQITGKLTVTIQDCHEDSDPEQLEKYKFYFVDKYNCNCDDESNGSPEEPYCSFSAASPKLEDGDTIFLDIETYRNLSREDIPDKTVTILSYPEKSKSFVTGKKNQRTSLQQSIERDVANAIAERETPIEERVAKNKYALVELYASIMAFIGGLLILAASILSFFKHNVNKEPLPDEKGWYKK